MEAHFDIDTNLVPGLALYAIAHQEHQGNTLIFDECNPKQKDANVLSLRKYAGKQLVSYLRQGDFAHAGEEEAIDLVMSKFKKNPQQQILDVGCGLGGTAAYIQERGWGTVTGFDIEKESIKYAIIHYPDVEFYAADVGESDKLFTDRKFDIICLFNSFYSFDNQDAALLALNKIAKTSSSLVIFDYSITLLNGNNSFYREGSDDQTPFKPVVINNLSDFLESTGWRLKKLVEITNKYIYWYKDLINKLEDNEKHIKTQFGDDAYAKAYATYSDIYNALMKKELGGVIVYAEKLS